jgi:hypothetical protein
MNQQLGLLLVLAGAGLLLIGILIWAGALGWFGRLPGDIRIVGQTTRIYIPITSMLLISLVLGILLHVIRRIFPG